jgi:phosphatidylinositol alpha-1,6-mannosyltransferase
VAGRSGGAHEAVEDGVTGAVVQDPTDADAVADALGRLLDDPELRRRQGEASRRRAVADFDYDHLARTLGDALDALGPALASR